jgi:DNA-binding response OmpR family regulator
MEPAAKILIVDDNEQNLTLIRVMLRRYGYNACLARSGEEALRQVINDPPDLIILDVMMPGLDGIEVCRRLKDEEETRLIPIVIMTALHQPEDKIRGIEAGADDFLTKPINQAELMARVRTALKVKRTIDQKVRVLVHTKEQLAKFVPLAVRRLVEENPEAGEPDPRIPAVPMVRESGALLVPHLSGRKAGGDTQAERSATYGHGTGHHSRCR